MTELFWNIFKKSGNLDAFLAYKEFSELNRAKLNTTDSDLKTQNFTNV